MIDLPLFLNLLCSIHLDRQCLVFEAKAEVENPNIELDYLTTAGTPSPQDKKWDPNLLIAQLPKE
jgi:hypothetical protein